VKDVVATVAAAGAVDNVDAVAVAPDAEGRAALYIADEVSSGMTRMSVVAK
jgi:hypothetical protein